MEGLFSIMEKVKLTEDSSLLLMVMLFVMYFSYRVIIKVLEIKKDDDDKN